MIKNKLTFLIPSCRAVGPAIFATTRGGLRLVFGGRVWLAQVG